jgi:hypothetical protein
VKWPAPATRFGSRSPARKGRRHSFRRDNDLMDEGSSEPDILEQRVRLRLPRLPWPGWRPSRGASILAAVTLAIGLAAGYAAGHSQARGTAAAPQKPAAPAGQASGGVASGGVASGGVASGGVASGGVASATIIAVAPPASTGFGPALTEDPGTCSVQAGRHLELGIPVTNQSGQTVLLESVKPVLPLPGMLKVLSWRWDPCGFDNDGIVPDTVTLGPGETTWVTAVVQPLVACPGPAPLQFQVTYSINSQQSTSTLPGFPDLSAVHYSGCPAPAP